MKKKENWSNKTNVFDALHLIDHLRIIYRFVQRTVISITPGRGNPMKAGDGDYAM